MNKKVTTVGGLGNTLELFMVDLEEFSAYLSKKCAASSTVRKEIAGTRETMYIVVQGKAITEIEHLLTVRYCIPKHYIVSEDKLPASKK